MLTARLKEGARERALELVGSIPTPLEPDGFEWLSVYLSECEVVFLTEAPEAELLVRQILDDPVRGTEIGPWLPLFDGPLHRAEEVYYWSAVPADTGCSSRHGVRGIARTVRRQLIRADASLLHR